MRIDVPRMHEDGEDYVGDDPVEILEWDPADDLYGPSAPVHYDLHAEIVGQELLVRGSVSTRFAGICTRCGGPLDIEIRDDAFCSSLPLEEEPQEVDLTPELRESILLALPSHPVCRPDCGGLCPRCGRRSVEGACGCADGVARGWEAFSALDVLDQGTDGDQDAP